MKVLVIGATGLAGQAMHRAAEDQGYVVLPAARTGAHHTLDITDDAALRAFLARQAPDLVVNCAALANIDACERDPWLGWRTNARPLSVLADWSNASAKPLIHLSTDHYFPYGGAAPHDEDAQVCFVNEYARQKFAGEAFALAAPRALVLRTSIVGLRGWGTPSLAEWALDVVENDTPATLFSDAYTSSIDAPSLAEAAFALAGHGVGGLLNLGCREVYSKEAFVRTLAARLGRNLTGARSASVGSLHTPRANCLGLDVGRAEQLLGRRLPGLIEVVDSIIRQKEESAR